MSTDEVYMQRCLQLALRAEGCTSPNPMVGALLVADGRIIAEGYHHRAGLPHAEPNAINQVADSELLRKATLYVSLEPCSHYGKTPPCCDLIIRKHIPKVVIATLDPNPLVAGRGVRMLQEAGVDVVVGVLQKEAQHLNRRFFTYQLHHRPYVILKWAQTADGFIDYERKEKGSGPLKISDAVTKTLNHQMRTTEDAIMVATRTAILDDPHLTVTKWCGKNPLRVLLDRTLKVPAGSRIFDEAAKTLVFTEQSADCELRIDRPNIEYCQIDFNSDIVSQVLNALYERQILSVIIEGGSQWLQTVIDSGLWDEAHVETGRMMAGEGIKAPEIKPFAQTGVQILYNSLETN